MMVLPFCPRQPPCRTSDAASEGPDLPRTGVQGGALSYRNCLLLHAALGFAPQPVHMVVAFGRGPNTWSNVGPPSELVSGHSLPLGLLASV